MISVSVFIFCYSINNISVTVVNSFGSNMFTSSESLRTIEQATNSMVTSLSAMSTSYSLNVSWSAPSSLCGNLIGYSVYVNSRQVHILCVNYSSVLRTYILLLSCILIVVPKVVASGY